MQTEALAKAYNTTPQKILEMKESDRQKLLWIISARNRKQKMKEMETNVRRM